MSKLQCRCEYIIRDQTDALPYKALFIPDEDNEAYFKSLTDQIEKFVHAREKGELEAFSPGISEEDIIAALASFPRAFGRTIYECENCGRIWVQKQAGPGHITHTFYASYLPEEDIRGVLQSHKKPERPE